MAKQKPDTSKMEIEDQLDLIISYLHKFEKRDKLRAWGGMIRSIIMAIPVIGFLAFGIYMYNNYDEFLKKVSESAAQAVMGSVPDLGGGGGGMPIDPDMLKQFEAILPQILNR